MTTKTTGTAIEAAPVFDQQVSVLVTDEIKAFLRGAVDAGPPALKEAHVVRALLTAGIDSLIEQHGEAWYADLVARGHAIPPVTRDR